MLLTLSNNEIDSLCENEQLDFKAKYWKHTRSGDWTWELELAKDLAALANTLGGHIVVGATEKQEILAGFVDPELPESWESGFRRVVGSFLRPSPVVYTELIALCTESPEVKQLIIEVVPSELVVVVTNPSDSRARLMVPIRHGSHTVPLPADRAIMQISSPFRRWSIHLQGIKAENGFVHLLTDKPADNPYAVVETKFKVQDVNIDSVTFRDVKGRPDYLVLPFDYIEAIWRSPYQDDIWYIQGCGIIEPIYKFRPRRG